MTSKGLKDENWQFWGHFILRDCLVFLTSYLAVRTGNWDLRDASLKEMAALFCAFNRPHYQKLIVQHLSHLLIMQLRAPSIRPVFAGVLGIVSQLMRPMR